METERYPFIKARWFTDVKSRNVRLVVLHTMQAAEKSSTAENIARYFQRGERKVSSHYCVDNDSIVQCVWDTDVAYTAPGANHDGIHIEQAGFAEQTPGQWADEYSKATVDNAARVAAQICLKYDLPVKRLTNTELRAGKKGIVDHNQVSKTYGRSSHWDCGPNYPWEYFLERTRYWKAYYLGRSESPNPEPTANDFNVVVTAVSEVDQILAYTLGKKFMFKYLPESDLSKYEIGYIVAVGANSQQIVDRHGRGRAILGASRWETADKVLALINGPHPDRNAPWG